jgi:hypothetical protein
VAAGRARGTGLSTKPARAGAQAITIRRAVTR